MPPLFVTEAMISFLIMVAYTGLFFLIRHIWPELTVLWTILILFAATALFVATTISIVLLRGKKGKNERQNGQEFGGNKWGINFTVRTSYFIGFRMSAIRYVE